MLKQTAYHEVIYSCTALSFLPWDLTLQTCSLSKSLDCSRWVK